MKLRHQKSSPVQIKKCLFLMAALLLLMLGLTLLLVQGKIDIVIADWFYSASDGWHFENTQPWKFLYKYGTVPGLVLTIGALCGWFGGFILPKLQTYRKLFLLIVITSVIGAGIIVNVFLKPYCGRPRPREIVQFEGIWEYCVPCGESLPAQGASFPCGHCTMGFLFLTLIFAWPHSRLLAVGGAGFGVVYGLALGAARAAQGAHFASDIVWSLGVILFVALGLYYVVIPKLERIERGLPLFLRRRKLLWGLILILVAGVITAVFLTRRPFSRVHAHDLRPQSEIEHLVIRSNVRFVKKQIRYLDIDSIQIRVHTRGFGWIAAQEDATISAKRQNLSLIIRTRLTPMGYFADITHQCYLRIPAALENRVKIEFLPLQNAS